MKVVCINDKQLPPDAEIVKGEEYEVESKFINNFDQTVYILKNITNQGRTRFGLPWIGYRADRFRQLDNIEESIAEKELMYHLN